MSETNPTMNDLMRDLKLGTADEDDLVPRPDPESVPDFLRGYVKGLPEKIYPKEFESISKLAKMTIPDAVVKFGSEPVTLLESLRSTAISENHDGWELRRFVEGYANLIGNPDAHKKTLEDVKVSVTSANVLLGGKVLVSSMKELDDTTAYLGVVKRASGVIVQHLSQNLVDYSPEKVDDAIGHFFRLLQMLMTEAARRAAAGNGGASTQPVASVPGGVNNNNNKAPRAPGFAKVPPSTATGTGTQHTAARSSVPSFAARGRPSTSAGVSNNNTPARRVQPANTLPYDEEGEEMMAELLTAVGKTHELQQIKDRKSNLDRVLRHNFSEDDWGKLRTFINKNFSQECPKRKNDNRRLGLSSANCYESGRHYDFRVALIKFICRFPNVYYKYENDVEFSTDEEGSPNY